ncbi:MAG: tRNA (adenosine(37)-N6)-threonylcarbamoyltransferase complex ATPase subunit type 1 TsaE [Gemmatimonadaceae bacterium]|nr:tRNA (adenosine(37)-N6)-threonylcarbamoyltransferase complex ATPase subunit type 1 TsaE [Gemmatimonadaceae bacterium]
MRLTATELAAWGEAYGAALVAPAVVTLAGDLGAGKTTLVQAICRGLGVTEPVTSPTFALVHEYRGARSPVYHLDLYRLRAPNELAALGWDELLGERAVVLIEWPERAGEALPSSRRALTLAHCADDAERRELQEVS